MLKVITPPEKERKSARDREPSPNCRESRVSNLYRLKDFSNFFSWYVNETHLFCHIAYFSLNYFSLFIQSPIIILRISSIVAQT